MKQIIVSFLCALAVLTADAQFLFRISGGGQEKPSYILGTIHTLPGTVLDSIPEFLEAEAQCQQLYAELEFMKRQNMNALQNNVTANIGTMIMPDGKTIYDVLSRVQVDTLQSLLASQLRAVAKSIADVKARSGEKVKGQINEVAVNNRAIELIKQLQSCRPLTFAKMLISFLNMEMLMQSLEKDIMNNQLIDVVCISRAKTRGMMIGELDDVADILGDLDNEESMDIKAEVDSFSVFMNTFGHRRQEALDEIKHLKQIMDYWAKGDFDSYASMDYVLSDTEAKFSHDKKRNAKWLPKMIAAMRKDPTMFVFGVAHLVGPYSIITKLRDVGYQVEQIKKN